VCTKMMYASRSAQHNTNLRVLLTKNMLIEDALDVP
jgi:hypothetical protein